MTKRAFMSKPGMSLADRLAARVVVDEATGCHNWIGPTTIGYGKLWNPAAGQNRLTHRIAYELAVGPIPDGFQIDHLCKNTRCCNPGHLEAVTPAENQRRSDSASAIVGRRTHCSQGHEYSPENTYSRKDGGRNCRACRRRASKAVHGGSNPPEAPISTPPGSYETRTAQSQEGERKP
jgi:hypothetical protein